MMTHFNSETSKTERILVVAGGSILCSPFEVNVELLYLDSYLDGTSGGWTTGPSLPDSVEFAAMNEVEDGVLIIGGGVGGQDSNSIYKLTPTSDSWEKLPQKLGQNRERHISFFVPDEIVTCSDSN